MMLEQTIQKRFVDIVTNKVSADLPSEAHHIYSKLIFYRLKEIFTKSFPRFVKLLDDVTFNDLIYGFIQVGANDPILWKVNKEFMEYILQKSSLDIAFLEDLLRFEYLEIEMHMHDFTKEKKAIFSLENSYKISPSVKIITLSYPVHHPEFDQRSEDFEKAEHYLVVYYKEESEEIIYEEITSFIKEFLQMLTQSMTTQESLQSIALKYEVTLEDILEVFLDKLIFYVENRVLVSLEPKV